jgi:hypothetical protein
MTLIHTHTYIQSKRCAAGAEVPPRLQQVCVYSVCVWWVRGVCINIYHINYTLHRFVLQFVIAKPAMAFISIMFLIVGGEGLYDSPTYQWILFVVYNLTYTLALVGLFYLYLACGELIAPYNPVMKFLAVKSIVFMTYWQTVLVETLPVNYISGTYTVCLYASP